VKKGKMDDRDSREGVLRKEIIRDKRHRER
jgi:hypothetical protein